MCFEEETFGLGIDDHFDVVLEAAGSGENASAASVTGLKVKSVSSPTNITALMEQDGTQVGIILEALAQGRRIVVKKAVKSLHVNHLPLDKALRSPTFTQCNGCLAAKQDRAWSLCLLSALISLEEPSFTGTRFTKRSFRSSVLANLISFGVTEPLKPIREGGIGTRYLDLVVQSPLLDHNGGSGSKADVSCPAMVSVLGPMASQETIKAITHVHSPISQFLVFESFCSLLSVDYQSIQSIRQEKPQPYSNSAH